MSIYNILHIAPWFKIGGAEKVLLDIVLQLDKNKFKSLVCAFQGGAMEEDYAKSGIEYKIIEKKRSLDFIFLLKLIRLIRRSQIDLVHCHGVPPTVYGGMAAKLSGIPLVITVHGRSAFNVKVGVKAIQYAQRFGARIITVSDALKSDLVRNIGLKEEPITTIHNGIDADRYPKYNDLVVASKMQELSLDACRVIGSIGSLREAKGHRYFIQSLPEVLRKYPDLQVVIVGVGELNEELLDISKKLNIEKNIHFLGQRRDVSQLISIFDILVQPSLTEGISIVILEAMASSKPVIATDVGGNSSLIVNDRTGLLIPSKDPDSIANAIIDLLGNEERMVAMGKAGFKKVLEEFPIQQTVSEYEKIYIDMIEKRNK